MTTTRGRNGGFTLVELVIVMILVGIVSAYAIMRNASPAAYSLRSQGESLAADLRHVQGLATSWSRGLKVDLTSGTNGSYAVSCSSTTATTFPCNSAPVIDPATGNSFSVTTQYGISISGPATLSFDSSGAPSAAATYTLTFGSGTVNVNVAAVTGFVTVTP